MSYSAADVKYNIDTLRHNLELPETEETWDKIAGAFKTFTKLCEGGAFDVNPAEVVSAVRSSYRQITSAMNSERTRLSLTAMDFISALATAMGRAFDQIMPLFLPSLLGLCARANKVIIKSARGSIFTIIETTQLANVLTYLQQLTKDKSSSLKLVIAEGALACLNSCNPPDLEKDARALEIEDIIRTTARDANADVRKVSRKIFDSYKILMPSRLPNFTAPMSPTTKKYLDIKGTALSTQPSTSSLRAASVAKAEPKPTTSSRHGHSRTTSTSTTASTMASTNARNAPTVMTRVARKDPPSHPTTLAPSRPVQAMRIAPDTRSTAANVQRKVVAPVRPIGISAPIDVRRPGSALSTHNSGPTRGTTVATSSSNVGAPHRLQVKPSTQITTNAQPGTSTGPRRVPVMAPPPVPAAAAAKEKEGPKRPTSRLDNATSTSTQRFAPTKKPAVPTAASSRDVKPPVATSDTAKGKASASAAASATSASRPAASSSSSSLKARPTGASTTTTSSSNASNATKTLPTGKHKPTWGRPVQPAKPVPVPRRTATVPVAPQKPPVPHAAKTLSRPAVATKTTSSKSKASSRALTPSSHETKKSESRIEAPEAEAVVETGDEEDQEIEEQALSEKLVKTPEPVIPPILSTSTTGMEEKAEEVNEVEESGPEVEHEEVDNAVADYAEDANLVEPNEDEENDEEEEELDDDEHYIDEHVEGSLPSDEGPRTPQSFANPPTSNPAAALAAKTPISALLSSIEHGFLYSPVTPLSPADLYLPNGATPYSHQTHAPHLQGGPRQPFNHALYAQSENGGIFGGFGGMAPVKREEDMVRGDLGVVPLHEHNKLFKGAGMSSLDDGNRQAFLELNQ